MRCEASGEWTYLVGSLYSVGVCCTDTFVAFDDLHSIISVRILLAVLRLLFLFQKLAVNRSDLLGSSIGIAPALVFELIANFLLTSSLRPSVAFDR